MPVYKADVIHKILRDQKDYFLDCLAGEILTRFETREQRNDFLTRMHEQRLGPKDINKKQADAFIDDLKLRVLKIWESNKN